jgi:hypothetical protein
MLQSKNDLSNLKNRIFGKSKEGDILDLYHFLMIHYGYIPFEEFKKMDASLVDSLVIRLNKMNEKSKNNGMPRRMR